jgi:hypothetical protein
VSPSAFRPISLQGCPVKIDGKILTSRLQKQVSSLVDMDQAGFIKGRSVNFDISAAGPHLLLYGAGRRGPTSHLGWTSPIRARL